MAWQRLMKNNELKKLVKKILLNHGLSSLHAEISSNFILAAELMGATSHGLVRLKMYCRICYTVHTLNLIIFL